MLAQISVLLAFLTGQVLCDYYAITSDRTCKTFYDCDSSGNCRVSDCPVGLIFHPGLNQCVLQNSYDCVCDAPSCTRPNCGGVIEQDIPDNTNCSRFYYCNRGYPLRRECLPGNIFNPDLKTCESRSTTKYQCPSDPFQCPQSSGLFPNTRDSQCHTYYACSNGQASPVTCDNDWAFHPKLGRCVLRDSYDCGQPQFQCPERNKDFADPNNANRYYYCMDDAPLHRTCPQGQTFKNDVKRCA